MAKMKMWAQGKDENLYCYFCPGCEMEHVVSNKIHTLSGDLDNPTLSPSVLHTSVITCHCFVINGTIQFLSDCQHKLAGQTVSLPDKY